MALPDYQTLMLPVLRAAAEAECRVPQLADRIAHDFDLSQSEREQLLSSGRQRVLHNRLHWARMYLAKAGLLESPARGRFVATKAGRALLNTRPARIDVARLMDFPSFRAFYKRPAAHVADGVEAAASAQPATPAVVTPDDQIEAAYSAIHTALRTDLLDRIAANTPSFFEQVIIDLLVAMGYGGTHENATKQLGKVGDGGVDGVISEDRLGLDRIYVQAKRYAAGNSVGRPDVQAFVGSLVGLGATKGVFVTTSSFSAQAQDFVKHLSQRVILIDGETLAELMIEHGVGVRTARTIEVKRLDEDFFSDEV